MPTDRNLNLEQPEIPFTEITQQYAATVIEQFMSISVDRTNTVRLLESSYTDW
jgi:hypothetical protein